MCLYCRLITKKNNIMKKLVVLGLVVAGFAMTSCKKDYTCECTVSGAGITTTSSSSTITGKKKDVEAACEKTTTSFGITTTCVVK